MKKTKSRKKVSQKPINQIPVQPQPQRQFIPKNETMFQSFMRNIYALNSSKFFAGLVMITLNIGSKYITLELSESQEDYIKYTLGRQILVFAILWMG